MLLRLIGDSKECWTQWEIRAAAEDAILFQQLALWKLLTRLSMESCLSSLNSNSSTAQAAMATLAAGVAWWPIPSNICKATSTWSATAILTQDSRAVANTMRMTEWPMSSPTGRSKVATSMATSPPCKINLFLSLSQPDPAPSCYIRAVSSAALPVELMLTMQLTLSVMVVRMDKTSGSSVTLGARAGESAATWELPGRARTAQASAASSKCPHIPSSDENVEMVMLLAHSKL